MNNLTDYKTHIENTDSDYLEALIVKFQGNQTAMAKFSGMNRGTLRKKLINLGLIRYTNGYGEGNWYDLLEKPKPESMGNTGLTKTGLDEDVAYWASIGKLSLEKPNHLLEEIPVMDVKRDQIDWVDENLAAIGDQMEKLKSTMQLSFNWQPIRKSKSMQLSHVLDGMNVMIQSPSQKALCESLRKEPHKIRGD